MSEIVTLHHEDWDLNKIFADLARRGVKKIKIRVPPEWQESEEIKLMHAKNILTSAEKFEIEVEELVSADSRQIAKKPAPAVKNNPEEKFSQIKFPDQILPAPPVDKSANGAGNKAAAPPAPNPFQPSNAVFEEKKAGKPVFLWVVLTLLVLVLIGGGITLSQRSIHKNNLKIIDSSVAAPTPIPIPTMIPSPTPTTPLNRENLTFRILNGTGVPGAAAKAKNTLEKLGYTVVNTGNAGRFDYGQSALRLKPNNEIYRLLVANDLQLDYSLAEGSALTPEDAAGAELIIGDQ